MQNYIKSNGYNCRQHKLAIFNTLIQKFVSKPFEQTEYTEEYKHNKINTIKWY